MAERRGPTDGGRFKRTDKSPRRKSKQPNGKDKPGRENLDTRNGESLLTPELQAKLVGFIKVGMYVSIAANMVGISTATLNNWLRRGRNGEQPFADLVAAVEQAFAEAEGGMVSQVRNHGQLDWRAIAWLLERSRHKRYGRRDSLELGFEEETQGGSAASVKVNLKNLTLEELETLERIREKASESNE